MGSQDVASSLRGQQRTGVPEERPCHHLLDVEHRADLARNLLLDVVALVEHEGHGRVPGIAAAPAHLDEDAEQLERVGRAHDQVIIGMEA